MLGNLFKFGREEFSLKQKVKLLVKKLKKIKGREEFKNKIKSQEIVELINSILVELGMHQKKGCYDPKIVDDIISKLEKRGIFIDDIDGVEEVIDRTKDFLYISSQSINLIMKNIHLSDEKSVDELITLLSDPTINSSMLKTIVLSLLTKREFLYYDFDRFDLVVDLIVTHPAFNHEILDIILLFEGKVKQVRTLKSKGGYYPVVGYSQLNKKKNKNKKETFTEDELELMFFKSHFITYPHIDLSRYRDDLLKGQYLTMILAVFKNKNLDLDIKKQFLVKLISDTLTKLRIFLLKIDIVGKEEIIRFLDVLLVLKNTELNVKFKKQYLNKLDIYDIEVLHKGIESINLDKEIVDYIEKLFELHTTIIDQLNDRKKTIEEKIKIIDGLDKEDLTLVKEIYPNCRKIFIDKDILAYLKK